jgi:alanine-glyoxylate transaminase / serine-glyoxylate transaminase / serine-pyruvate transaminase
MLNTVIIPEGANDLQVRSSLLKNYNIEIGGGLGDLAGKVWRIGLMGTSSTRRNVILLLGALYTIFKDSGVRVKPGGLEAANEFF